MKQADCTSQSHHQAQPLPDRHRPHRRQPERTASSPGRSHGRHPPSQAATFPRNFRTGKPYRGVNVFLLWSTPYSAPFWLTYKQAQEMGGTVRKGEKGTAIVFYKQFKWKKDGTEEAAEQPEGQDNSKSRSPFMLTSYTVFNVEQCDGIKLPETSARLQSRTSARPIRPVKTWFKAGRTARPCSCSARPSVAPTTVPRLTPCTCRHASVS